MRSTVLLRSANLARRVKPPQPPHQRTHVTAAATGTTTGTTTLSIRTSRQHNHIHTFSPVPTHSFPYNSRLHTYAKPCGLQYSHTRLLCTREAAPKEVAPSAALQKQEARDVVLSPPALVITREYEWANIIVGFEQANKYTIRAAPGGQVVGYLAEDSNLGSAITRNILRTRRPFKATVLDKDGTVIFTLRRPLYLISSSLMVETPEGELLGEVHMNWHVYRRRYNLYVDKAQFASVDSGFLAVDFDMRDVDGRKIASVNKDFTGFAREIFTDARQYVLRLDPRFGLQSDGNLVSDAATVDLPAEDLSDMKLGPRERAIILATAVSIDFDYFSLHSRGHSHMLMPGMMGGPAPAAGVPPVGGVGGGVGGAGSAAAVAGADTLSGAAEGAETDMATEDPYGTPLASDDGTAAVGGNEESEWATFEEPDHGFAEQPSDDAAESDGSWFSDGDGDGDDGGDGWGDGGGGGDGEGGGGIFGFLSDMFGSD